MMNLLYHHHKTRRPLMKPLRRQQCCIFVLSLLLVDILVLNHPLVVRSQSLDQFNYDSTKEYDSYIDYGPNDWGKIQCRDVETCLGWADKVPNSQGWQIGTTNHCIWCPKGSKSCGAHHNSPINLDRNLNVNGSSIYNECIDGHWMKYFDSSCSFDELRDLNGFTIERYGLKITQPMAETTIDSGLYGIACSQQPGTGRRWGRVDFPKGFSQWWLLSHIDFHVPSEHTQNGKQYSGELQLHHYYSVTGDEAGIDNEIAAISIFLEVYDDANDWPILNRVICAWREAEEKNRAACGLPSIASDYPGCFQYNRKGSSSTTPNSTNTSMMDGDEPPTTNNSTTIANTTKISNSTTITNTTTTAANSTNSTIKETNETSVESRQGVRRRGATVNKMTTLAATTTTNEVLATPSYKPAISAHDIILENYYHMSQGNTTYRPKRIQIEKETYANMDDFDWDAFIYQSYIDDEYQMQVEEERKQMYHGNNHDDTSLYNQNSRHLMNYRHVSWFNYFPMVSVKTEYFFRYSGSQTMPPCYGKFISGGRKQTLHWRVMKDPIRVSHRQIMEMHRLIKDRIAPKDAPLKACRPDTAAAEDPQDPAHRVVAARPVQEFSAPHWAVFCDCASWRSKFEEDQKWCRVFQDDQKQRYFEHPYNFETQGF